MMKTDWAALRIEYVHSSITMRALAEKHGINAAGVLRRAAKEGWDAERKNEAAKVISASSAVITESRIDELVKFNQDDIKVARAIRSKAAQMLQKADTPAALRSLASAFDTAQKIGRLALGASTENSNVSTRALDPLPDDAWI
jgi:ABC-type ATPase with predicted acetyltransferase domain